LIVVGSILRKAATSLSNLDGRLSKLRYLLSAWRFESAGPRGSLASGVRILGDTRVRLGSRVALRRGVIIGGGGELTVGTRTSINEGAIISATLSVTIGEDCMLAPRVYVLDVDHRFDSRELPIARQGYLKAPVVIEDDVWIGAQAVITRGVRIGRGAIIGANSVVTKDVPPYSIAAGIPARVVKQRPE